MSCARILLVDDDDGLRTALRRALEREGYAVVEAGNGRHALDRLKETSVDLRDHRHHHARVRRH
ncbi:MAG: response regulator [Verrucomicrobia bacterium]|nr:response regulator [Verrucomicrobiota bacterium]